MRLHNAIACLIPYLPALSASSPIYEGRIGPHVDNRLAFYRDNQRRIPLIAGAVVPELIGSYRDYRRRILQPIYRALDDVPGGEILQHEWVNSRGAIMRFMRRAIEIRVLDMQERVKADVAVAVFIRAVLRWMVAQLEDGSMALPDHRALVSDFTAVIQRGRAAAVEAPHLKGDRIRPRTATDVLELLADHIESRVPVAERAYLALVTDRIARGNLSERIVSRVRRHADRSGPKQRAAIREVYEELAACLRVNRPWDG